MQFFDFIIGTRQPPSTNTVPAFSGFAAAFTLSLAFVLCIYFVQTHYDASGSKDPTDPSRIYNNLELRVDASQEEIRLLYLHPGNWEDKLVCTLKAVELSNNPHYVALSYAWRENQPSAELAKKSTYGYVNIYSLWTMLLPRRTRKRLIKVNNGNLGIGINLELALRHMRSLPGGPTTAVFADAICINQKDLRDRSTQVTLLREIYRKAARVEIWLGAERCFENVDSKQASPRASQSNLSLGSTYTAQTTIRSTGRSEDGSETSSTYERHPRQSNFEVEFSTYTTDQARVFAAMDDWYQYYSRPKLFRSDSPPDYTLGFFCMIWLLADDAFKNCGNTRRAGLTRRVPFLSDPTRKATLEVFSELMSRVWWHRLWVLQEMTIASDLVVRYGRFVIPWELLARASKNILHHRHETCCSEDFEKLGRRDLELLQSFTHQIAVLDRWRARWNKDAESATPRISLLRLMRKFRDRETTNPRDKVYALLPLVNYWGRPKVNAQMVANYDLSISDVFKKVTKTLLSMEESLDVLVGCRARNFRLNAVLPSWVPDWSATATMDGMVERTQLYRASASTPLHFRTFGKNAYLELRGISHDIATCVGDVMPSDVHVHGHASLRAQAVFRDWKQLARLEEEGYQDYHECSHSSATGHLETKSLAFVRTMCMDSIYVDHEDDEYDLESSSHFYERTSKSFRDSVNSWNDPIREPQSSEDESDGGLVRALPLTSDILSATGVAESLLPPLAFNHMTGHRDAYSLDKAVETATSSRRFFVTQKGYFGLGPAGMLEGDRVFVLAGGSVPFILRDAGKRQIPGLNQRQPDMTSSRYVHAPVSRGRGSTSGSPAEVETWSDCSSTPAAAGGDAELSENSALEMSRCTRADRSRSTSTSLGRRGFAPNGSFANEVSRYKVGISIQPQKTQSEASASSLSQCYTLVGDCFVHGIMDGEATVRGSEDGTGDVDWDLIYLI